MIILRSAAAALAVGASLGAFSPANAVEPLAVTEATTPAGLAFWHMNLPKAKRDGIIIAFPSHLNQTPDGKEGTAGLAARLMMYGGAGGRKPQEIMADMKDLQATGGVRALGSRVELQLYAEPGDMLEAAETVNLMLTKPTMDEVWMNRIRDRGVKQLEAAKLKGGLQARNVAMFKLFGNGKAARFVTATPISSLSSVDLQAVKTWQKNFFNTSSAIIVATGKSDAAKMGTVIDTLLAGVPKTSELTSKLGEDQKIDVSPRQIVLHDPNAKKSTILVLGKGRKKTSTDGHIFSFAQRVLGGTMHSRLFKALRTEASLVYRIRAHGFRLPINHAHLAISSEVETKSVGKAVDLIKRTYATFHSKGVTQAEFNVTRDAILVGLKKVRKKPRWVSRMMILAKIRGRDLASINGLPQRSEKLTLAELNAYIKNRLSKPEDLTVIVVSPDPTVLPGACVISKVPEAANCKPLGKKAAGIDTSKG